MGVTTYVTITARTLLHEVADARFRSVRLILAGLLFALTAGSLVGHSQPILGVVTDVDPESINPILFQNQNLNYEVLVREGDHLHHYWFDLIGDRTWKSGERFGVNVQSAPAVFVNRNGNFDLVVREGDRLHHYWHDSISGRWNPDRVFGQNIRSAPAAFQNTEGDYIVVVREGDSLSVYRNGSPAGGPIGGFGQNVQSAPAAILNSRNGNYEVVVREGGGLRHYWWNREDGWWNRGEFIAAPLLAFDPVMFQNSKGNYEVLVRQVTPHLPGDEYHYWIQHFWFAFDADRRWHTGTHFGSNVRSTVRAFQNIRNPNYEVLVREGDSLHHYWFAYDGDKTWKAGAAFGGRIQSAAAAIPNWQTIRWEDYTSVPLGNYEVVVWEDGHLQHYWYSYEGRQWNRGGAF